MNEVFGKFYGFYLLGKMRAFLKEEKGQTLVEYALILVLIAIVVMLWLSNLARGVNNSFSTITSALP